MSENTNATACNYTQRAAANCDAWKVHHKINIKETVGAGSQSFAKHAGKPAPSFAPFYWNSDRPEISQFAP